jgi:SAM-dependent methyltransferase
MATTESALQAQTISDFGAQWTSFQDNPGYYASLELFEDIFAPLLKAEEISGQRVAEIGSGTGRIVNMLLAAGAGKVLALEPSAAYQVLKKNVHDRRVTFLQATGDQLPATADLDYVFSIGVLHHIPDPAPAVAAAYRALQPGGRIAIWLYGKEGNRLLLTFLRPLRLTMKRLPDVPLWAIVWLLYLPLLAYMSLCRVLPLPLHCYLARVLGRFDPAVRRLVIYDQLNPAYAKYYTRAEARELLAAAGFVDIRLHHRHGYSWTVVATRP